VFCVRYPKIYDLTHSAWFSGHSDLPDDVRRKQQQKDANRSDCFSQSNLPSELALFSRLRLKADFKASGLL
jgi:hypothetical protein